MATPEDNSYIEALHGLLEKELFQRYEYSNQYQAKLLIANYYTFYNTMRPHSNIGYRSPNYVWNQYFSRQPNDKYLVTEAENISSMASAKPAGGEAALPVIDIFEASAKFVLSSMNGKTVITDSTVFKKTLQLIGGRYTVSWPREGINGPAQLAIPSETGKCMSVLVHPGPES